MSVFKRIEPTDVTVTPFKVHKTISEVSGSSVVKEYLANFQNKTYNLSDTSDSDAVALDKTTNNRYQFIIHDSINQNFYENFIVPREGTLAQEHPDQRRILYKSALVLAVDQNYYGEGLKPGTIQIVTNINGNLHTIIDDSKGNLIDTNYSASYSSSFAEFDPNRVGHWNFAEGYIGENDWVRPEKIKIRDLTKWQHDAETEGVAFDGAFNLIGGVFDGNTGSYARVIHNSVWNFKKNDDFCIVATFKTTQSGSLVTKNGWTSKEYHGTKTEIFKLDVEKEMPYPFSIEVNSSGKAVAKRSDGKNVSILTSTTSVDNGTKHIVHFVKTGSELQLYVDGTSEDTATDSIKYSTNNVADLFIGSKGKNKNNFSGSIFDIRIYDEAPTPDAILTGSTPQKEGYDDYHVGNVFYEHGMCVLTNPSIYYAYLSNQDALDTDTPSRNWTFTGRGTKTSYEYEIVCKVDASDLNSTVNPSALNDDKESFANFTTHSLFNPYVTQIGLYNDDAQLLAVSNISRPIPKMNDKDMAFIIRFDV